MKPVTMVIGIALVVAIASVVPKGGGDAPSAVAERAERGALIIDTRTANEYAADHVDGAINISHDAIGALIHQTEPDSARGIVVYCRTGRRSSLAKKTLIGMGYTNVVNAGSMESARAALTR